MNKCIIRTMTKRIVQNVLGTVFIVVCFLGILAIPVALIKAAIMLLGERVTALLGAGGISLALMLWLGMGLVRLYREARRDCQWK